MGDASFVHTPMTEVATGAATYAQLQASGHVACHSLHVAFCGTQLWASGAIAIPMGMTLIAMLIHPPLEKQILGMLPFYDARTSLTGTQVKVDEDYVRS